jgi:hypothetical protein
MISIGWEVSEVSVVSDGGVALGLTSQRTEGRPPLFPTSPVTFLKETAYDKIV